MIARTVLPGTSLTVSRFGFGTARIHRLEPAASEALLRQAHAAGFTHFDTAPLYGFGASERALQALRGLEGVTIATKVGLYPPGGTEQGRMEMLARKVLGKAVRSLSRAQADASVARAKASFEGSLKRLGREHVDLLLLHEPDHAAVRTDEWQRWIEGELAGRVRVFGLAGEPEKLSPFVAEGSPLAAVMQTREGAGAAALRAAGRAPQITFGHLAGGESREQAVAALRAGAQGNASGMLLVSSRDPARLSQIAEEACS